jgi:hypothetical protein
MKIIVGAVGVVVMFLATSCTLHRSSVTFVSEGFEGTTIDTIDKAFWLCWRLENDFRITSEQARSGKHSLKLAVNKLPLFAHLPYPSLLEKEVEAQACMESLTPAEAQQYLNDESERAELREDKKQSPTFGDDTYYGFSMLIGRASAPEADFNRMVVGQWKGDRNDSPFLSLRMTGGFFHITLAVTADRKPPALFAPKDCKVLLAFAAARPPNTDHPLKLTHSTQCESRLNYDENQGQPAPTQPLLTIERFAYLPDPFGIDGHGVWIDLIFHIKGGPSGVVEVWANGVRVAKATGWIGFHDIDKPGRDKQYFKFGPYRDPAGYSTVLYLDNLSRGGSKEEVDPSPPWPKAAPSRPPRESP